MLKTKTPTKKLDPKEERLQKKLSHRTVTDKPSAGRGTTKPKKFSKEHYQSTELEPFSNLLTKPIEKCKLRKFNLHESPVANKVNKFENENSILNKLSQIGSTPERSSESVADVLKKRKTYSRTMTKRHFTSSQKCMTISKAPKKLVQTYKYSNSNSTGTNRLKRFLQKYSQEAWNQPLSSILKIPKETLLSRKCNSQKSISFNSYIGSNNNALTSLNNNGTSQQKSISKNLTKKLTNSASKNYKHMGPIFQTKIYSVDSSSTNSSESDICRKNTLFKYFKETKNVKDKSVEKSESLQCCGSIITISSFSEKSTLKTMSGKNLFSKTNRPNKHASLRKWSDFSKDIKGRNFKQDNERITNIKKGKSENSKDIYDSSLYKGLDFIEEFSKEYDNNLSKVRVINEERSNTPCSSKSEIKRKSRSQTLEQWLKRNPIVGNDCDFINLTRISTQTKSKKRSMHRKCSSIISFMTKSVSSQIVQNRTKNIKRLKNSRERSSNQDSKKHDEELKSNKNTMTRYFFQRKLVHNKENKPTQHLGRDSGRIYALSLDRKEKAKQLTQKTEKLTSIKKTSLSRYKMDEKAFDNWSKSFNAWMDFNEELKNSQMDQKQNNSTEVGRKIQKNLYSSEGFCESMSLETPAWKNLLSQNYPKRDPDASRTNNLQKIYSRETLKKGCPSNTAVDKGLCSSNSLYFEYQNLSQKPRTQNLTRSEEREFSPDHYVMKMCGQESRKLVEKILSSHKSDNRENTSHDIKSQANDAGYSRYLSNSADYPKFNSVGNDLGQKNKEAVWKKLEASNLNSLSESLSFGNPSFSGNADCSPKNRKWSVPNDKAFNKNENILNRQIRRICKGGNKVSGNASLNQCSNSRDKQNIPLKCITSPSLPLESTKNQSQIRQNGSQLTQKEKNSNSQILESLYKLNESNSWHTQGLNQAAKNIRSNHLLEKNYETINSRQCQTIPNQEIKQIKSSHHECILKEPPIQEKKLSSKNVTTTTPVNQNILSSELFTQSNIEVIPSPDLSVNFQLNSTERNRNPIFSTTPSLQLPNYLNNNTNTVKSQSQNNCDDPFLHKLLTQNFIDTLNDNNETYIEKESIENSKINVYQTRENCASSLTDSYGHNQINYEEKEQHTETQAETENYRENTFENQNIAKNIRKKSKKAYNITEECILFEDNLLKNLIEDKRSTWKMSGKKKVLKRKSSEGSISQRYIKRYRKGNTKIFKIKRRFKKEDGEDYKPPEGQIMNRFLKKLNNGFKDETSSNSDSVNDKDLGSVATPLSYQTDETKSEVLSTGSSKLTEPQKLLRQGINKLSKDKSLLFSKFEDPVPREFDKFEIVANIEHIVNRVLNDFERGNNPYFKIPKENISNCFFADGRYQMKESPDYRTVSYKVGNSRQKFNLILFLLNKLKSLLETDTKLTKREIYYQLKTFIKCQGTTDRALKEISRMLNVGLWALNVTAQKGLVYGPLKLVMADGETINCNIPGTLIPQDISRICEIQSSAYFILVVEKESIFHKLLEENLPNRLTRPFILITGKGFPDLNTQLFLRKLWMVMSIPVFIFVDADPDGIAIMLNYRFGSIANAHVSEHLAIPKAKWLGVFPSEILRLSLSYENLGKREISMTQKLLQLECVQENEQIKIQLEKLLENGIKTGIEGLVKADTYLSNCYLSLKFFTNNLI